MKNGILFVITMTLLLASCVEQKYIFKSNTISTIVPANKNKLLTTDHDSCSNQKVFYNSDADSLYYYDVVTGFQSRIKQKGDNVIIEDVELSHLDLVRRLVLPDDLYLKRTDLQGKFYFIEQEPIENVSNFKYLDSKPVLQGLSIPLKIRPKLRNFAPVDSFPSQAETGFNPALAFGWKFNLNSYSLKKDIFGKNLKQFSFTPGWFLGTGAVDLKKLNTRNPPIIVERKVAIISTGGFFMLGYNSINLGYSFGWDYAMGEGRKSWLYQGKMWHGITIGLDIIK